jgi:two-component system response regulator YesN
MLLNNPPMRTGRKPMYKLLVVDDEFNIRDGLVHLVPWNTCDVVVSGEAENGLDALERAREIKPDLVISDISMDVMDGLEFIERLKQMYPEVKIIILSGYDDFDYAKRALQLKVSTYLLKPVSPAELIVTVKKLTMEIDQEKRLKERIINLESEMKINREVYLDRLLHDLTDGIVCTEKELQERLSLLDIHMDSAQYCCLIASIDGYHEMKEQIGIVKIRLILQQTIQLLNDLITAEYNIWSYIGNDGHIIALLGSRPGYRFQKNLSNLLERFKMEMRRILEITSTISIGSSYVSLCEISHSYLQALKALDYKVISGPDSIIHIDDINIINNDPFIYPHDKENLVLKSLSEGNEVQLRDAVSSFFTELENRNCKKHHLRIAVMELFSVVTRKFMDLGLDIHKLIDQELLDLYKILERFDTVSEIRNWMTNLVVYFAGELRNKRQSTVKSVVTLVQDYITANYMNPDISLNSIAEHVYLNSAYLSKMYKKETGENYLEFLTRLRIDKAKYLLRTTHTRTSDVGNMVGYPNPQYFATIFRKNTGLTPVDFREKA